MYVIKISRHGPEACPAFVEKYKDVFLNAMEKDEALARKHDIKIIGAWVDSPSHTAYSVYETPSMEKLMEYSMEPDILATMSFQTSVFKPLKTAKEIAASIKRQSK